MMPIDNQNSKPLWFAVGRTLDAWQRSEELLCELFLIIVCPAIQDTLKAAFYTIHSVPTKCVMISAALTQRVDDAELKSKWARLKKRTECQAKNRNYLAHSSRWIHDGREVLGPHIMDKAGLSRHLALDDQQLLDVEAIDQMRTEFYVLEQELAKFIVEVGNHTRSFGRQINVPNGAI